MDTSLDDPSIFGDGGGESFGNGLDNSALDLSGSDAFSLDFLGETPLQGNDVALSFSDGTTYAGGITDLPQSSNYDSFFHDTSLSGVSDPSPHLSASGPSLNGSGSALSQYSSSIPISDTLGQSSLFSAINKFGTSFATLLHSPSAAASPGFPPANGNPNYKTRSSISGSHAALLVGVALLLVAAIALGGSD